MYTIKFSIYFCPMSDAYFSDTIMIYKPHKEIVTMLTKEDLEILHIRTSSELIYYVKQDVEIQKALGNWGLDNFTFSHCYVYDDDYLFGLRLDKTIEEMLMDFKSKQLHLCFFISGGASFHDEKNYHYIIHPDEKIHRHLPHVHIEKAGESARYSLENLEALDALPRSFKKDEKKFIMPYLQENRALFLYLWRQYNEGYSLPIITQESKQIFPES